MLVPNVACNMFCLLESPLLRCAQGGRSAPTGTRTNAACCNCTVCRQLCPNSTVDTDISRFIIEGLINYYVFAVITIAGGVPVSGMNSYRIALVAIKQVYSYRLVAIKQVPAVFSAWAELLYSRVVFQADFGNALLLDCHAATGDAKSKL